MSHPEPFYEDGAVHADADGTKRVTSVDGGLIVLPDGEAKAMLRTGKKKRGAESWTVRWMVGELDGVRVYVCGNQIIMSKRDLYP